MKYDSFKEYLQLNYIGIINEALEEWIKENDLKDFDSYIVNSIKVTGVQFLKSRKDRVEFMVSIVTYYDLIKFNSNHKKINREHLMFKMSGTFKKGFKVNNKEIQRQEVEFEERLSSGLVPIISYKDLDTYASKFLLEYCPEALERPIKLDLTSIFKDKDVKIYLSNLDEAYGKIFFAKDRTKIYDGNELINKEVEAGTIIIDYDKYFDRPIGAYRNTAIHEAVHWFFHRNYFELRLCLNNNLTSYTCYKKDNCVYEDDIYWMEWQAKKLAPRILMPKKPSIMKIEELENKYLNDNSLESNIVKYETIIKEFADFFGVTIQSARIRFLELNRKYAEGVLNYIDNDYINPFLFKENTLKKNQSFTISSKDLFILLSSNIYLQEKLEKEEILYINKLLVVNNPKYVDNKNYILTDYALDNVQECCLVLTNHKNNKNNIKEINNLKFLCSINNLKDEYMDIDFIQNEKVLKKIVDNATHYENHKKELPNEFSKTLEYHYNKAKENQLFYSYEDFAYECDISEKTIRSYKDGKSMPDRTNIIKMAFALRLSGNYIFHMLKQADLSITKEDVDNSVLLFVIYAFPRAGLENIYKVLKEMGKERILNLSKNYKKNHYLS